MEFEGFAFTLTERRLQAGPVAWASSEPPRLQLLGPPVSRRRQRALGIERFTPGLGYQKRKCACCRQHLWLGPRQLGLLQAVPDAEAICNGCAQPELAQGLKDGTFALSHLGGRGGGYHYADGRYLGPQEEC